MHQWKLNQLWQPCSKEGLGARNTELQLPEGTAATQADAGEY